MFQDILNWAGPVLLLAAAAIGLIRSPSIRAIAANTFRDASRRPVVWLVTFGGALILVLLGTVPLFSMMPREEMALTVELGVSTITLAGLIIALFSATSVVAEEIENKTALMIFARGVRRWEFLVGKYLGVLATILVAVLILGLACQAGALWKFSTAFELEGTFGDNLSGYIHAGPSTSYGAVRTYSDQQIRDLSVTGSWFTVVGLGIGFSFAASAVMAAAAVAISTRLPMTVNAVACLGIYSVGNLIDYLSRSASGGRLLQVVRKLILAIIPNLSVYDIVGALGRGQTISGRYLFLVFTYTCLYIIIALFIGHLLLNRRDMS